MVSPSALLPFLARSISIAELRQHPAQAREPLSSIIDGNAAVDDCAFQSGESFLDSFVEGVQILRRHRSVYEFSQCLEVQLNRFSLIRLKISLGERATGGRLPGRGCEVLARVGSALGEYH